MTHYSYNAGIKTTWGLSLRHLGRLDLSVGTSKYVCLLAMSHVKCDAHDSKCFCDFMLSIGHALCNIFAHITRLWVAQAMPTQGTPAVVDAYKSCYFLKENSSFSSTTSSSSFVLESLSSAKRRDIIVSTVQFWHCFPEEAWSHRGHCGSSFASPKRRIIDVT